MSGKDISEWSELGARLASANGDKFDRVLDAVKRIVDAQEMFAEFEGHPRLVIGRSGRYSA